MKNSKSSRMNNKYGRNRDLSQSNDGENTEIQTDPKNLQSLMAQPVK
jgi:hypothetical protein